MPAAGMLTQAEVPLPWSRWIQMLPPSDWPWGRVKSEGGVPLTRL
jgi:hypothetical protein